MINNYCSKQKSSFFSYIKRLLILSFALSIAGIVILFRIFEVSIASSSNSNPVRTLINDKEINRGKIIDRNDKIISATISTLDLYIDPIKIINSEDTVKILKKIFPKKSHKFFINLFRKKKYRLISTHLTKDQ